MLEDPQVDHPRLGRARAPGRRGAQLDGGPAPGRRRRRHGQRAGPPSAPPSPVARIFRSSRGSTPSTPAGPARFPRGGAWPDPPAGSARFPRGGAVARAARATAPPPRASVCPDGGPSRAARRHAAGDAGRRAGDRAEAREARPRRPTLVRAALADDPGAIAAVHPSYPGRRPVLTTASYQASLEGFARGRPAGGGGGAARAQREARAAGARGGRRGGRSSLFRSGPTARCWPAGRIQRRLRGAGAEPRGVPRAPAGRPARGRARCVACETCRAPTRRPRSAACSTARGPRGLGVLLLPRRPRDNHGERIEDGRRGSHEPARGSSPSASTAPRPNISGSSSPAPAPRPTGRSSPTQTTAAPGTRGARRWTTRAPRRCRQRGAGWAAAGARLIGGCCGLGPAAVREIAAALS